VDQAVRNALIRVGMPAERIKIGFFRGENAAVADPVSGHE
jgi:hypothetical protein